MFVFVDVVVFMSVRGFVVRVFVCMGMSVFVLMLVAMIVFTFHWVSSLFSVWRMASPVNQSWRNYNRNRKPSDTARPGAR